MKLCMVCGEPTEGTIVDGIQCSWLCDDCNSTSEKIVQLAILNNPEYQDGAMLLLEQWLDKHG